MFFAGVTPFPYKVITIASGVTQLDIVMFMVASVLARGARFFAVTALLYVYGPPIRDFIERRLGLVATVVSAAAGRLSRNPALQLRHGARLPSAL